MKTLPKITGGAGTHALPRWHHTPPPLSQATLLPSASRDTCRLSKRSKTLHSQREKYDNSKLHPLPKKSILAFPR